MEISVHDSNLHSYCVSVDKQEICLHTSYAFSELREFTDIVFAGVVAYHFYNDNLGTILFDVYETKAEDIYVENRDLFEHGRKYLWPGTWNTSDESVLAYLIESEIRGYELSVSIGMSGWVWAKSMSFVRVPA